MLHYQSFKYYNFCFFFYNPYRYFYRFVSQNEWLLLSDQVSIIKRQNGYFMRHDLISSYSSYSISIVRRNSVLKQSSKTNCIFRVKLVLDRASIADIPITDLLINRIESLALRSIKWFPTKTR